MWKMVYFAEINLLYLFFVLADGMDNDVLVDAPRPSIQDGKTPANSLNQRISKRKGKGSYPCKQCTRWVWVF